MFLCLSWVTWQSPPLFSYILCMVRGHALLILLSAGWYSLIYNSNSWHIMLHIILFSSQICNKTEQYWPLHLNCCIICSRYENTHHVLAPKHEVAPQSHWVQTHCFVLYKPIRWIYHCALISHDVSSHFYSIWRDLHAGSLPQKQDEERQVNRLDSLQGTLSESCWLSPLYFGSSLASF